MLPDIWALDYILGFLYILLIYACAFVYKNNKVKTDPDYKYFLVALNAKIFGGIGFLLLSLYYWKGGDTFTYYDSAHQFSKFLTEDPEQGLKILLLNSETINWFAYDFANGYHKFLGAADTFTAMKITAIINLLSCRSYVTTTILFSFLSFLGTWNMYYVFCKVYPNLKKELLWSIFFIPSVILWGSGILKDTITMAAIGWVLYSFINIIILKRKRALSFLLIIVSTLFIALLKPYILYVLYPALFIWVQSNLKEIITSKLIRNLIAPFIAIMLVFSSYFLLQKLSENAGKYDVNKLEKTLEGFQSWHTTISESHDQSGYTLGEMDFSPMGISKKIPAAIGVTFFRPYVWEIRNASTMLGALEALVLTITSLWLLLTMRMKLFRIIYRNKDILFLIIFSLVFGFIVGISSYNFGALSRYKMPAQMFFVVAIVLIFDKTNKNQSTN